MNIKQFSQTTGISSYTIRYYEKLGLLRSIQRNSSGYRDFSNEDVIWIEFIKRLKDTAMPLKDIQTYAKLRDQGESTQQKRMDMLNQHAIELEEKIHKQTDHLKTLKRKIEHYKKLLPA